MFPSNKLALRLAAGAVAASLCFGCSNHQSTQPSAAPNAQQLIAQQDAARQTQIANIQNNPNISAADKQQILNTMGAQPK
jgi:hypothetical protein